MLTDYFYHIVSLFELLLCNFFITIPYFTTWKSYNAELDYNCQLMLSSNLVHIVPTIRKDAFQKKKAKAKMITTEASNNKHNDQGALSAQPLQTPQVTDLSLRILIVGNLYKINKQIIHFNLAFVCFKSSISHVL